jgi:hypothetical protein
VQCSFWIAFAVDLPGLDPAGASWQRLLAWATSFAYYPINRNKSQPVQLHRKYYIIEIGTILALAIQRVLIDLPPQNQHIHRYPSGTNN